MSTSLILLITVNVFGFSKPIFPSFNYCTPIPVKENISIEKLQIGDWVATQPNVAVPLVAFGNASTHYDFSLKGTPLTRDTFYWQIWVDLNGDLDFDDAGENLLKVATARKQKAIGKLTLPVPTDGQLSLRVMLSRTKANNPCGTLAKVMDYYDFSIVESCPEVNADQQVKIDQLLPNQATLSFNLPTARLISWQIKNPGQGWSVENTFAGSTLTVKDLEASSSYAFHYRLQCKDLTWTAWSDSIVFTTKDKPKQPCFKPSLDSIAVVKQPKEVIQLTYTGKTYDKVIWNYPSYDQQCRPKSDTTKKEIELSPKNGERISVRLKGVCASGEVSPFSDTLWFERPCVSPKTTDFIVYLITDKTADVWIREIDRCEGRYSYYVTTDTTLHDSLWSILPDPGYRYTSLQNLLPNTQYFIKISDQCYNDQNSVLFSGFQSFKTLPTLSTCEKFDSSEISFRFDEAQNELWLRVNSSKTSVYKAVDLADANQYQITRSMGFSGDSIPIPLIPTDTKYLVNIQNTCGTFKSEWTTVTYIVSSACAKMNTRRLRHSFKDDKYYLSYDVNPEIPIRGPYLWRYRKSPYGSPWIDSLISDTNTLELPQNLLGQSLSFSVRPLANLACGEKYWSGINDYFLDLEPCPATPRFFFSLKSVASNAVTFNVYGEWIPEDAFLRLHDLEGNDVSDQVYFDLPKENAEYTLTNLKPNTRYVASICTPCQVGTTMFESCPDSQYFTTLQNIQPNLAKSLSKVPMLTNMKLVPNPSSGLFQVELPNGLEGSATLSITNLNGQLIQRTSLQLSPGAYPQLDLSQQTQGVYFIYLQLGKQVYQEKLVLIH